METIVIKGGSVCYTKSIDTVYEVVSGEVLAFIIPIRDKENGRRLYLGSFTKGGRIPGFAHDSEVYGSWRIVLAAMDTATISVLPGQTTDKLLYDFAAVAHLPMMKKRKPDTDEGGKLSDMVRELFEEALIEKYNREEIKQDGYIYATIKEKEITKENTLRIILNAFAPKGSTGIGRIRETGNRLYDAVAILCAREKISISPLEDIEESSGRKFDVNDIARVSHFVIREVVLEDKWYKRDCGSFLAFVEDEKHPVAIVPMGPCMYICHDPATGKNEKVTKDLAARIMPAAYVLYRPFPDKVISPRDLVLFGLQKVYSSDIVRMIIMSVLGVLLGLLIPYLNEQAYDRFIPLGDAPELAQLGGLLAACAMGGISFTIVKNLSVFRSLNTMCYAVQAATFDRLFRLPESFYRKFDAAMLGTRAMEISTIFNVLGSGFVMSALSVIFSVIYLHQMYRYSREMAAASLVMMVMVTGVVVWIGVHHLRVLKTIHVEMGEEDSAMFQFIKGISKLRMAGAEDRALERYMDKLVRSTLFTAAGKGLGNKITAIVAGVPTLFSIVFYFMMVNRGLGLSIGSFSAFCAAFGAFSAAVFTLIQKYLDINQIRISYGYVRPILETLPESPGDVGLPGDLEGEIEISNVTFGYDKEQEDVIKNLSLRIAPGEYVGIVGPSGCGKTTLLKLLLGFEKPQKGRIYYDNMDIEGLDKRELRKKFGVVLQDCGLIPGTIYENITITSGGIDPERVNETVKNIGLDEDIRNMPMGLHTIVSEESDTVSGGQKQRIMIARAIVGRPRIIFLDEATSALDNTTQARVVDTLSKLEATKVVIAHRLSTVAGCDRIIVMDKGQIKEEGTYDELMERKGLFYELAARQIS